MPELPHTDAVEEARSALSKLTAIYGGDCLAVNHMLYAVEQAEKLGRLIDAVRQYAVEHYNDGGWDVVVEAMSSEALATLIGGARTERGAISKVASAVSVWADQQADARVCAGQDI